MNWKLCIVVLINAFLISFPYNILGCSDGPDPYHYYSSFFHNDLSADKNYRSFYYTNYEFLYDDAEQNNVADTTSAEWISYCGNRVSNAQAYAFICEYAYKDLASLYYHLEKAQSLNIPDSVKQNTITQYFLQSKNLEALGYLMYAKQVQPLVTIAWDAWSTPAFDTAKAQQLLKNGMQLFNAAKTDFIKLRYAYQLCRLAYHNQQYDVCIQWNDNEIQPNKTASILHNFAAGWKAGALYKMGKKNEAALYFAEQFFKTDYKKTANYLSFDWCINRFDNNFRNNLISQCNTNESKANMIALFALGSNASEQNTLEKIYALAPASKTLPVLVTREINKLEEFYFTPNLQKTKGGSSTYFFWYYVKADSALLPWKNNAKLLIGLCEKLATNKTVNEKSYYNIAAAHTAYILQDYNTAKKFLSIANQQNLNAQLKDQYALTSLLVTVNEKQKIDAAFEQQLLPSAKWLQQKVKQYTSNPGNYWEPNLWRNFYENFFTDILAKRYHAQGDIYKEALCIGMAEAIGNNNWRTNDFVQNEMQTPALMALHALFKNTKQTLWEKYLVNNFPMKKDEVTEVIAMTHVRDYNFTTASAWCAKIKDTAVLTLERNPFGDLLYDDQENFYAFDKGKFTKPAFVKQMMQLMQKETANKASAASLYKMAVGFYNLTYYGRAWQLVKSYRSGSDGYYTPADATNFQKEYYGAYTAEKYFEKAMKLSADKNFKARCLFMMAKCAQKQVRQPQYSNFPGNYQSYDNATDLYFKKFKNNKYFTRLVNDYGKTAFYKEAYNTCSYLSDFVQKK
jgi:hypothetical protein